MTEANLLIREEIPRAVGVRDDELEESAFIVYNQTTYDFPSGGKTYNNIIIVPDWQTKALIWALFFAN